MSFQFPLRAAFEKPALKSRPLNGLSSYRVKLPPSVCSVVSSMDSTLLLTFDGLAAFVLHGKDLKLREVTLIKGHIFLPALQRHNSVSCGKETQGAFVRYSQDHYRLEAHTLVPLLSVRWMPGDVLRYARVLLGSRSLM